MPDPEANSSHNVIETPAGTLDLAKQAAQRGAADACEAANRTWAATGRFVSRCVYTTCYTLSYGVVFPSVLLARSIPVNNAAVRGLVDGANHARVKVAELRLPAAALEASTPPAAPALLPA
jgi:hypothetical protein